MRHIQRKNKPAILEKKEQEWLEKFLQNGKSRPDSSKYAHNEIKTALLAMSHQKCYYCERKVKGVPKEVDHFIEVAIDQSKAFEWENLYIACTERNKKANHNSIPVTSALDPCKDSDKEIVQHITFEDEIITAVNGSEKGLKTIKKYRLGDEKNDYARMKLLNTFKNELLTIQRTMIKEERKKFTKSEQQVLQFFKQADQPFSMMFKVLLAKIGL